MSLNLLFKEISLLILFIGDSIAESPTADTQRLHDDKYIDMNELVAPTLPKIDPFYYTKMSNLPAKHLPIPYEDLS